MLFPAALSGLASPVTLPETELLPMANTSHSRGWKCSRQAWETWLSTKGWQGRRRIKSTQLMYCRMATDPDKRGQKGKMTRQKLDWEISRCQNSGRGKPGTNGGCRGQDSGAGHFTPRKLYFYSLKKDKI